MKGRDDFETKYQLINFCLFEDYFSQLAPNLHNVNIIDEVTKTTILTCIRSAFNHLLYLSRLSYTKDCWKKPSPIFIPPSFFADK